MTRKGKLFCSCFKSTPGRTPKMIRVLPHRYTGMELRWRWVTISKKYKAGLLTKEQRKTV